MSHSVVADPPNAAESDAEKQQHHRDTTSSSSTTADVLPSSEAQSALLNPANPSSLPPASEKHGLVRREKGSPGTEAPTARDGPQGETNGEDTDPSEEEDEVVYPGGLQLALLTFGLCMATLSVGMRVFLRVIRSVWSLFYEF